MRFALSLNCAQERAPRHYVSTTPSFVDLRGTAETMSYGQSYGEKHDKRMVVARSIVSPMTVFLRGSLCVELSKRS